MLRPAAEASGSDPGRPDIEDPPLQPDDIPREHPSVRSDDKARRRHDALNLLMVIDLSCESLLQRLAPGDPMREEVEQIAEARAQLAAYFETRG